MVAPSVFVGVFDFISSVRWLTASLVSTAFAVVSKLYFLPPSHSRAEFFVSTFAALGVGLVFFMFFMGLGMAIRSEWAAEADRMRA